MHKQIHLFQVEFQPIFYFFLFFILGILLANILIIYKTLIISFLIINLIILSIFYYLRKYQKLTSLLIMFGFLVSGFLLATIEKEQNNYTEQIIDKQIYSNWTQDQSVEIYGEITEYPKIVDNYFYLSVRTDFIIRNNKTFNLSTKVKLLFWLNDQNYKKENLTPGTIVQVLAQLQARQRFQNPGGIDTKEILKLQGYDFSASVKSPEMIAVLVKKSINPFIYLIYELHQHINNAIEKNFTFQRSAVLKAIILGDDNFINAEIAEKFRVSGLYHILVISGSHIAFLTWLLYKILKQISDNKWVHFIIITLFIWLYSLVAGADPPIMRATLMATVMLIGTLFYRQAQPSNLIAITGLILLAYRPVTLFEASFQLTFLAITLILLIVIPLVKKLEYIANWYPNSKSPFPPQSHKIIKWLAELLFWNEKNFLQKRAESNIKYKLEKNPWAAKLEKYYLQKPLQIVVIMLVTSIIVQLGLLPLSIIYFHRIVFIGIILNILAELLMSLLLTCFVIFIIFDSFINTLSGYLIYIINYLVDLFIYIAWPQVLELINKKTFYLSYRIAGWHSWQTIYYIGYWLIILFLLIRIDNWQVFVIPVKKTEEKRNKKKSYTINIIIITLYLFALLIISLPNKYYSNIFSNKNLGLEIVFLDVGQGDAIFIQFPQGTTMMIDSGGEIPIKIANQVIEKRFSIGEQVDSPYLWSRGLEQLDYIVVTHPHLDHMQGFNEVISNFDIKQAILPYSKGLETEWIEFKQKLDNSNIASNIWSRGQTYFIDGVKIEVLWPDRVARTNFNANNQSLVLYLSYQNYSILLTGDIEGKVEYILTNTNDDLEIDVLKVPHHASKTSSTEEFLEKTSPKFAIISAPAKSRFNHPHPEVLERYKALGTEIYQTGLNGAVTVYIKDNKLEIKKYK
ncbi:MAG: ComEC/Rec2 family competence protein [Blastocatellia bacterium]|nr:ComEC/Rec2 family competence protein [Blastocatellia bacterium]MBL8195045.1 ComEC/Rec2 family competence protein [Blastocatellia bacterium]